MRAKQSSLLSLSSGKIVQTTTRLARSLADKMCCQNFKMHLHCVEKILKMRKLTTLFLFLFCSLLGSSLLAGDIFLDLEVSQQIVTASWKATFEAQSYTLYYAPWPEMEPIGSINLGLLNEFSTTLPYGSAYYVAVGAVDEAGNFHLSNIEYFRLKKILKPDPGISWQWQLNGHLKTDVPVDLFDIDLFETSAETIAYLKSSGRKVICYFNAGAYEPWRPDAYSFPEEVLGNPLEDWPDERWLDIRRLDILAPIMKKRLDLAVNKGCDGVEPDNIDGYLNETGFPLTREDQIRYNLWLAREAHKRGLSIGLKNNPELACFFEPYFDWALSEECFYYQECENFLCFITNNKAVLEVEYELEPEEFCPEAIKLGFSALKKNWDLDSFYESCKNYR